MITGIALDDAYVTNIVKHFKWEPKRKRRPSENRRQAFENLVEDLRKASEMLDGSA
jgi:hypothetical protein